MQKNWTKFLGLNIISVTLLVGGPAVFAEQDAPEDTKQQIYLSQMAKYPVVNKEFSKEIDTNAHPRPDPSEGENIFLWQLEEYKMLNTSFADVYSQNVSTREVPATPEEVYLWQLEEYKELDKTFYNEHRREF